MPKPPKRSDQHIIPVESIQQRIYLARGYKVMLDADLADLYGVTTGRLNEQVRRNKERFPEDFMFQLTAEEHAALRSQIAISKGRGGRRYAPLVFTEQGVAMLSSVLNSKRAVQVNILIMRAFVQLRELMATHKDLVQKLEELEEKVSAHHERITAIFEAVKELLTPGEPSERQKIGFQAGKGTES